MKEKSILITSIGRRVELILHLKETFRVIGVDASDNNAARHFTDTFYLVPKCNEDTYINALLDICVKENVEMIIPLFEHEFDKLCECRNNFEKCGITILLSDSKVIEICNNKFRTQEFFQMEHIMSPKVSIHAPAVLKPVDGMGSKGIYIVENEEELNAAKILSKGEYIIQEKITGKEYTIDVLCNFNGEVVSVVPRVREEVRSGEVSKSRTEHNNQIISDTIDLINKLNKYGKVIGPITVQCFLSEKGKVIFIEINPRFGGGVPLTFYAGVNYGKYLESFLFDRKISKLAEFNDVCMERYDMAVYKDMSLDRN